MRESAGSNSAISPFAKERQGDFEIDGFRLLLVFNFEGAFNSCFHPDASPSLRRAWLSPSPKRDNRILKPASR
jgi:hypothetical protein